MSGSNPGTDLLMASSLVLPSGVLVLHPAGQGRCTGGKSLAACVPLHSLLKSSPGNAFHSVGHGSADIFECTPVRSSSAPTYSTVDFNRRLPPTVSYGVRWCSTNSQDS